MHFSGRGFLNGASSLMQYVVLPLNVSEYYLMYAMNAIHVLGILNPDKFLSHTLRAEAILCQTVGCIC